MPGDFRYDHTMEGLTVCGGSATLNTGKTCITLLEGSWQTTTNLTEDRYYHSSWDSPTGVRLLGGKYSSGTSERIQEDGTSFASFDLEYSL